jgi:hypothetical protein
MARSRCIRLPALFVQFAVFDMHSLRQKANVEPIGHTTILLQRGCCTVQTSSSHDALKVLAYGTSCISILCDCLLNDCLCKPRDFICAIKAGASAFSLLHRCTDINFSHTLTLPLSFPYLV